MKLKIWIVVILGISSAEVLGADGVIEPSNPADGHNNSVMHVGDGGDEANGSVLHATLVRKSRISLQASNPNVPAFKRDTVPAEASPLGAEAGIPRINSEGTDSRGDSTVGTPKTGANVDDKSQTFPTSLLNN